MKKLFLLAVCLFLFGCATVPQPTPDQLRSANYGSPPQYVGEQIISYFDQNLIDPLSGIYRFCQPFRTYYYTYGPVWNRNPQTYYGWAVCGEVNAKNRMGGYMGRSQFWVFFRDGQIFAILQDYPSYDLCQNQMNQCQTPIYRSQLSK